MRPLIYCIALLLGVLGTQAQTGSTPDDQDLNGFNPHRCELRFGGSLGYSVFRDEGTAPISYKGIGIQPNIGFNYCHAETWQVDAEIGTFLGIFENAVPPTLNFSAYDIYNQVRLKYLHRIHGNAWPDPWELQCWVGGGLHNFATVTINSHYENASAGVSEFICPALTARIETNSKIREKDYWTFYGEMSLFPVAAVFRPGYSYIDNYTASTNVATAQFSDYEMHFQPLAGATTDLGVVFHVGPQYALRLSYLWNVHSSGKSGAWKYVQATHLLAFDLTLRLTYNNKR
ncbi:MAG: hypothetical protein K5864_08450 [Bacteroidales bacterium]|nr:hypothetical protein [Bacteroidales bacterium]